MTKPPAVSIVIPLYNAELWIEETLWSVLGLEPPTTAIEIIIVDDGSTDNSRNLTTNLLTRAPFPFQVLSTLRVGPSGARNAGWQAAKGDWIQFLDADDLLHPQKLEKQLAATASLPADVAVVYSNWRRWALVGGKWVPVGPIRLPRIGSETVADLLTTENFIHTGSALFSRSWLERVHGWDNNLWFIEDVDLAIRLAMAGAHFWALETPEPMFYYRVHPASLSHSSASAFAEGCARNAVLAETYWMSQGKLSPAQSRLLAGAYLQAARSFADSDPTKWASYINAVERVAPNFVPTSPALLASATRVLGFRRAEAIATYYRRLRRYLRSSPMPYNNPG